MPQGKGMQEGRGEAAVAALRSAIEPPLYVDLDGTLVEVDTLRRSLQILVRSRPWLLVGLPLALRRGRAGFKAHVARRVTVPPETLPYNRQVLAFLRVQQQRGRALYLATAAHVCIARAVALHVRLFDGIIATSDDANLKGRAKLEAIRAHAPGGRFDYMGDSMADLPLFADARRAYLVNPSPRLLRLARRVGRVEAVFPAPFPPPSE